MRPLGSGLYHIRLAPFSGVNAYLAHGFLFDAGTRHSAGTILRALQGHEVIGHALTHVHPDHQGATHAVCEALDLPLFVSGGDAQAMMGKEPMSIPRNPLTRLLDAVWSGPPHPVTFQVAEGDEIGRFRVISTPGHSAGHVAFWDERDGVLVLGDVLRNMSYRTLRPGLSEPPEVFTVNPARNRASARKLIGLRPHLVLFGHGPPLRDPDGFDAFLRSLPT